MQVFDIPEDLISYPVVNLLVSLRAKNGLLRNGYRTLGNLHGVGYDDLLQLRGLGAKSLSELVQEIPYLVSQAPHKRIVENQSREPFAHSFNITIDERLYGSPLQRLPLRPQLVKRLVDQGIITIKDVIDHQLDLLVLGVISQKQLEHIMSVLSDVAALPVEQISTLCSKRDDETFLWPDLGLDVLSALVTAKTARDELFGLINGLDDRRKNLILHRWGYFGLPAPTLEAMGEQLGITRERVRQLVDPHEDRIKNSGIRLPVATQVVRILESSGGILSQDVFIEKCIASGIDIDNNTFQTLESLSELKVIPSIKFDTSLGVWIAGGTTLSRTVKEVQQSLRKVRAKVIKRIRLNGCVSQAFVDKISPLDKKLSTRYALARYNDFEVVQGYILPKPPHRSRLSRAIEQMLYVAQPLPMTSIINGLKRVRDIKIPPEDVLEQLLPKIGSFSMRDGWVSSTVEISSNNALSRSQQIAINAFKAQGGVLSHSELAAVMERHGYSLPTANVILMSAPFLRRTSVAIYALRGVSVNDALLRDKRAKRRAERQRAVVNSRWDGDRLVVRYRMTRFALQGVFPKPVNLKVSILLWRVRFPDGSEAQIKMRNGFLWSFMPWLHAHNVQKGDILVATFYPAESMIELDILQHASSND